MSAVQRIMGGPRHWRALGRGEGNGMAKPPGPGKMPARRGVQPFDYQAHQIGRAGQGTVWVSDGLGSAGDDVGRYVLSRISEDVTKLMALFGLTTFPACDLIIAPLSDERDGTGGAYHYDCSGRQLYADFAGVTEGERTLALLIAELSEVGQAVQDRGWDCGASHGEALSRLHAEILHPGVLDDYSTVREWLASDRNNWIDESEPTDTNPVSIGCGMLYLWWLIECMGVRPEEITQAGGSTLAEMAGRVARPKVAAGDFLTMTATAFPREGEAPNGADNIWPGHCEGGPVAPPPAAGVPFGARILQLPEGTYLFQQIASKRGAADASACHQLVDLILSEGVPVATLQGLLAGVLAVAGSVASAKRS